MLRLQNIALLGAGELEEDDRFEKRKAKIPVGGASSLALIDTSISFGNIFLLRSTIREVMQVSVGSLIK